VADKRGDEETYSLIFSSLKHPIRRKIVRMLENGEMTFSEILEILAIDSGHLSYHLENLGDDHTYRGWEIQAVEFWPGC
jgi:DNA-binding transcriptional ArsR family regulator